MPHNDLQSLINKGINPQIAPDSKPQALLDAVSAEELEADFGDDVDLNDELDDELSDHLLDDLNNNLNEDLSHDQLGLIEEEPPRANPEEMLMLLTSTVTLERMQAARAFCEIEEPRAIPLLICLLQDDCTLVRVSAAYALGRNPAIEAVPNLIRQLQTDWNGYVRKGVVWALGNCGSLMALVPLISALRYDIAAVRLWAASALGQLGNAAAIAHVTMALQQDKVDAVRSNCAWTLGKLLAQQRLYLQDQPEDEDELEIFEDAIDALIGALEDDDLGVGDDARLSLRKLGHPRGLKVLEKIELDQGYCDLY